MNDSSQFRLQNYFCLKLDQEWSKYRWLKIDKHFHGNGQMFDFCSSSLIGDEKIQVSLRIFSSFDCFCKNENNCNVTQTGLKSFINPTYLDEKNPKFLDKLQIID